MANQISNQSSRMNTSKKHNKTKSMTAKELELMNKYGQKKQSVAAESQQNQSKHQF